MRGVERRTFLVLGAVALGLAGCTNQAPTPRPDGSATAAPETDPDDAVRSAVAASELALIASYRTAIEAHPELADELGPFLIHHEAHLARIAPERAAEAAGTGDGSPSAIASASGDGSTPGNAGSEGAAPSGNETGTASPTASPSATRPSAAETVAALADAEAAARRERIASCDAALDPALARNLVLIAASEAQHAAVLEDLAEGES